MGSSSNNHPDCQEPSLLINVSNFVSVKLSTSNYQLWKTQMCCFIDNVGLFGFIDGTTPSPPPSSSSNGTTNDEYRRWRRLDQRLKGWILGSLSEEVLRTVVGFDTASAVWKELDHSFGPDLRPPVQMKENSEHEAEDIIALCPGDLEKFVESQTTEGNTALSVAAMVGNTEDATILATEHPSLLCTGNCYHSLPMHLAAKYAHEKTLWYLLTATEDYIEDQSGVHHRASQLPNNPFEGQSGVQLLVDVIISGFIEIALYLVLRHRGLAILTTEKGDCPLAAIARMTSAFTSGNEYGSWEDIMYFWHRGGESITGMLWRMRGLMGRGPSSHNVGREDVKALRDQVAKGRRYRNSAGIMRIWGEIWVHFQAIELVKRLCTEIKNSTDRDSYRLQWEKPILVAAKFGTHEVVEEIVRTFSNEIWSNNEDRNYIILLAVKYRCKKVFKLILENRHRYAFLVPRDTSGNNILHIAAKLAPSHTLNLVSGAALLQMQSELQWFQEVQKLVNPCCKEEENSSKETPGMVFTREHGKLVVEAERWLKDTANSCTTVAALIATVAFAAAITVPGGNNGNSGLPIFSERRIFEVFLWSNAASLFSSLTCLIAFLTIVTLRCAERDFLFVLPQKLFIGLFTLFASILFTMVSFSSILILVSGRSNAQHVITILLLSSLPFSVLILWQWPLIEEVLDKIGIVFRSVELRKYTVKLPLVFVRGVYRLATPTPRTSV